MPAPACAGAGSSGHPALGPRFRGDDSKTCCRAFSDSIFKQPSFIRASVIARILCGAGYAVVPAPFAGPSFSPRASPREWSAKRRTSLPSCRVPRRNAGASRRSTAAISDPRVRVSWFPSGSSETWDITPHRQLTPCPVRNPWNGYPVQRAPRRAAVVPPDRVPRPPGSGVTSPARRRRIPSRCQNVS
jgi:hypothetical protein